VDRWGHYRQNECNRLCSFSLDQGVTFFNNGDAYGQERAETVFGRWMKSARVDRSKIQIGSNFGYEFDSEPAEARGHRESTQNFSPAFMRSSLEKSLTRLGTDHVDLFMAEHIKLPQFRDDLFAELEKVKSEGKIRAWGVSLGPAIGWRDEGIRAMLEHDAKIVQTVFDLFEQDPGREFCQTAKATRSGVLARMNDNVLALADPNRIDSKADANDDRNIHDPSSNVSGLKKLERVRHYATNHDMTVRQLLYKWLLQQPALTSISRTFRNEDEIREACQAVDKPAISRAEMEQISRDYSRDWNLGDEAHPRDLNSSTDPSGKVRSGYIAPPVLIA
jgi:aryl-alcohol dehydrogenase-like predicted oxidoreductase